MNYPKLSYRPEIDGLRAIAVVSVILYHAQIVLFGKDWFEGGFIGVDIFFVLSGYLITRIILSELQARASFSFLSFYERRARRILPMLFTVIFVSMPFAWQMLLPSELVEYAGSILSSLFFSSNFFFYFSTTEYGANSALLKPFLHTWSLGVEEQFYLVFPILAVFAFKYCKTHFLTILFALSLLSLQFAELMEVRNSDLNFYLPLSRFWELAVGSMLAYKELNYRPSGDSFYRRVLPILGFYLVIYSILFFDGNTPHPGFYTLIPIIGVALIIGFSSKDELVGKILGSRPFVWVGLISYSAYLWHFPIFAFARMWGDSSNYDKFGWIILTFVLSILSFLFIEKPFRKSGLISSKMLWFLSSLSTCFVALSMFHAINSDGIWTRYSKPQQEAIRLIDAPEYSVFTDPGGTNCNKKSVESACRFGNEKIVFLGDSYIGSVQRAFVDVFDNKNLGYISFNYEQCPFVMDMEWYKNITRCSKQNRDRVNWFKSISDSRTIFISAHVGQFGVPQRLKPKLGASLSDKEWGTYRKDQNKLAWKSYLDSIKWLRDLGHNVVIVSKPPQPEFDSRKWVSTHIREIKSKAFPLRFNKTDSLALRSSVVARYADIDGVTLLDPTQYLCDGDRADMGKDSCMDMHPTRGPMYNSGSHLSYNGARLIAEMAYEDLEEANVFNY